MPSVAARAAHRRLLAPFLWLARRLLQQFRTGLAAVEGGLNMNRIRLLRMLAAAAVTALAVSPVGAQTNMKFALDWKFEGPSAPYFVAID